MNYKYASIDNNVTNVIYAITSVSIGSLNCTFENNFCNWKNKTNAIYNWIRNSGPTPSTGTGPFFDHTTGTASGRQPIVIKS